MLELRTTHSRSLGAQACYNLKWISDTGHFHVVCSSRESERLYSVIPDASFSYEALAEIRRQPLITDVPTKLDSSANLPQLLEDFVEKFRLLEEYGRCTMELFSLGHCADNIGHKVLSIALGVPVHTVEAHLTKPRKKLADWRAAMGGRQRAALLPELVQCPRALPPCQVGAAHLARGALAMGLHHWYARQRDVHNVLQRQERRLCKQLHPNWPRHMLC